MAGLTWFRAESAGGRKGDNAVEFGGSLLQNHVLFVKQSNNSPYPNILFVNGSYTKVMVCWMTSKPIILIFFKSYTNMKIDLYRNKYCIILKSVLKGGNDLKRIMIPTIILISICVRTAPTADCISTNAEQIDTEITLRWHSESTIFLVDSEVNNSFDFSGSVVVEAIDPREYRINIYSRVSNPGNQSRKVYSTISPDEIIGSGTNNYRFQTTVFIHNQTENAEYFVIAGGEWVYTLGLQTPEQIPEVGLLLQTDGYGSELDLPHSDNNTSTSETAGMDFNLVCIAIGFIVALSYINKRKTSP